MRQRGLCYLSEEGGILDGRQRGLCYLSEEGGLWDGRKKGTMLTV